MPIALKILNGTQNDDHKCVRCDRVHMMTDSHGQDIIVCRALERRIMTKIVECNKFRPVGMDLEDFQMTELAWTLEKDASGRLTWRDRKGRLMSGKRRTRRRANTRIPRKVSATPIQ